MKWRPLFELLAATGLRISEAIGLRWSDVALDGSESHLQVRRAVVRRAVVAPKSRHVRGPRSPPARDGGCGDRQRVDAASKAVARNLRSAVTAQRRQR